MSNTVYAVVGVGLVVGFLLGVWAGVGLMVQGMPQSGEVANEQPHIVWRNQP